MTSAFAVVPTNLAALLRLVLLFGWLLLPAAPASAAETAAKPNPSTAATDEIKTLIGTLEDEGKRAQLLATLKALIAAEEVRSEEEPQTLSARITAALTSSWTLFHQATTVVGTEVAGWPQTLASFRATLADPAKRSQGIAAVGTFLCIFAAGWVAELVGWRFLNGARQTLAAPVAGAWGRIWRGLLRILIDLLPLAGFAAAAYLTALFLHAPAAVQAVTLNFVNAYVIARALIAVARTLLWPKAPALRALPVKDAVAKDLFRWIRRFVRFGVAGFFLIAAGVLLGLPRSSLLILYDLLYLALAVLAIVMVLANRQRVAALFARRGKAGGAAPSAWARLCTLIAPVWHLLAILYILAFFVISAFAIEGGFTYMAKGTLGTVAALALAPLAGRLLRAAPQPVAAPIPPAGPNLRQRLRSYAPFFRWLAAGAVLLVALLVVLEGWGIEALAWLASARGQRLLGAVASIGITAACAILAWEAASGAIGRYLTTPAAAQMSPRARTLLPLLQKTLFAFLAVMVVLITLAEIGIDITPLLAGAGVVGLAIGFGAQKLVQDVITGFFMLIEDAVAVGDVVAVAGVSGVVEDMSVRALKLRDVAGSLHTVPFSAVTTVSNMTKTFSYYVLDIAVGYDQDPDRIGAVCKEIVEGMRQDPAYARSILEPLEVFGLDSFSENSVLIKARIKTVPMRQWAVGREFNRRMKKRFEELGIKMPSGAKTILLSHPASSEAAPPPPPPPPPAGKGGGGEASAPGATGRR